MNLHFPIRCWGRSKQPEVIDVQSGAATQVFTHEFHPDFLTTNPAFPNLPTLIRMFNDPLINLFASGGKLDLNQMTTQLGRVRKPRAISSRRDPRSACRPHRCLPSRDPETQPLEPALSPEFVPIGRSTRPTIFEPRFGEIRPLDFDQIEQFFTARCT